MKFFDFTFSDSLNAGSTLEKSNQLLLARILIMVSAFSCFIYFTASRIVICAIGVLFCLLPVTRDKIFADKNNYIMALFTFITSIVAIVNGNYLGFIRTCVFASMMVIFSVNRKIATKEFYEKLLDVICVGGCLATVYSIIEMIIMRPKDPWYRSMVTFSNANFFGVAIMFVILICAYKAISRKEKFWLYFGVAAFNSIGLYLSESISLWVIGAIGIICLLVLNRNYKLLIIFVSVIFLVLLVVIIMPQFIPRLNEISGTTNNRVKIWTFAIEQIKEAPIFGRGFFSYKHLYNTLSPTRPDIFKAALAHNLLLDCLLCHGFFGTTLIAFYIFTFVKKVFYCREELKKHGKKYTNTIFAISTCIAIACYGIMDTTFVWVQTGMILLFIISGVGIDERKLRHLNIK